MEELTFIDYLELPLRVLRKHPDFDAEILDFVTIVSGLKTQDLRDLRDGMDEVVGIFKENTNG